MIKFVNCPNIAIPAGPVKTAKTLAEIKVAPILINVEIEVKEDTRTVRVPKVVKENVKRGIFYLRKQGKKDMFAEKLLEGKNITVEDIQTIKKYFDSQKNTPLLKEGFKGRPHEDNDYVMSLLRGGEIGYKWVVKECRRLL